MVKIRRKKLYPAFLFPFSIFRLTSFFLDLLSKFYFCSIYSKFPPRTVMPSKHRNTVNSLFIIRGPLFSPQIMIQSTIRNPRFSPRFSFQSTIWNPRFIPRFTVQPTVQTLPMKLKDKMSEHFKDVYISNIGTKF